MTQVALTYASHPPSRNAANILLIGMEGIGKGILAKSIVDIPADYSILCHTATTLEQIRETARDSGIDYVVFMVDTSRKMSLETVKVMLEYVDAPYFLGRSCFVGPRRGLDLSYEDEGLFELAGRYDTPVLFTNVNVESDVTTCAGSVVRMAGVAAGMARGVTSLLLS